MRLFGRSKVAKPGAVINGEYVADAVEPSRSGRILRFVWRLLLVILVLILLYLAYLFLKDLFWNKDDTAKKPTTTQGQVNAPGQSSTSTPNSSGITVSTGGGSSSQLTNNSTTNNSGSSSASSSSSSSSTKTGTNSSSSGSKSQDDLANSGPGDVLALFIGTTLLGASVYHIRLRKKLSSAA